MLNDQDIKVDSILKRIGMSYNAILVHEVYTQDLDSDHPWQCDKWRVSFGDQDQTFDYYTGLGHRTDTRVPSRNKRAPRYIFAQKNTLRPKPQTTGFSFRKESLTVPTAASVLHSLLWDADAGDMTHRDFCDTFGYDVDSIKARRLYLACQNTRHTINSLFEPSIRQELQETLEDY